MHEEFKARDFGYTEWGDFLQVIRQPQLLRFEIRKHRGKLKHAQNRLEIVETQYKAESEISFGNDKFLALMEGWVEEHRAHLGYCERRLKFLEDAAQGVVHEDGPGYKLKHQPPPPPPPEPEYVRLRGTSEIHLTTCEKVGAADPDGVVDGVSPEGEPPAFCCRREEAVAWQEALNEGDGEEPTEQGGE